MEVLTAIGVYNGKSLYSDNNEEIKLERSIINICHPVSKDKIYILENKGDEAIVKLGNEIVAQTDFDGVPIDLKVIGDCFYIASKNKVVMINGNEETCVEIENCVGVFASCNVMCLEGDEYKIATLNHLVSIHDESKIFIDNVNIGDVSDIEVLRWLGGDVFLLNDQVYKIAKSNLEGQN